MNLALVKDNIDWNFSLENEFANPQRKASYTFVIDQYKTTSQLALYRIGPYSSHTEPLENQPPVELLKRALLEQQVAPADDGLYYINDELRSWIEMNVLETEG